MSSYGGSDRYRGSAYGGRWDEPRRPRVADRDEPRGPRRGADRWDGWEDERRGGGEVVRRVDEEDVYDRHGRKIGYDRVVETDRFGPPAPFQRPGGLQRRTSSLDRHDTFRDRDRERDRWDRFDKPRRQRAGSYERESYEEDIRIERPERYREDRRDSRDTRILLEVNERDHERPRWDRPPVENMQISRRYEHDEYDDYPPPRRGRAQSMAMRGGREKEYERETEIIRERQRMPVEEVREERMEREEYRPTGPINVPVKVELHLDQRALREEIIQQAPRPQTPPPVQEPAQFEQVIEHERRTHRHTHKRSSSVSSHASSSSSDESVKSRKSTKSTKSRKSHKPRHDEDDEDRPWPRKGITKISYKLVSKRAIVEKGYDFKEEDKLIVIQVALNKDQIDELLEMSEAIRKRDTSGHVSSSTEIIIPAGHNLEIIEESRSRSRARKDIEIVDYEPDRKEVLMIDDGRPRHTETLINMPDGLRIEKSKSGRLSFVR